MKRIVVKPKTKFHDLTVIREVEQKNKRRHFLVECHCGRQREVRLDHLRSNHSTSCGECWLKYDGQRKTITAWARSIGVNDSTLRARLKVMTLGEALERGKAG